MKDDRQGWSRAYHFHQDKYLTITQAMKLRQGNDPRAGDLHCHRDCFFGNTGDSLITVKEAYNGSTRAHFRRSKSRENSPTTQSQCSKFSHAASKRETMDYGYYFSQFENYLNGLIGKGNPYIVSSVEQGEGISEPDFILDHEENEWGLSQTFVTIIDENKKRNSRLKSYNMSETIYGRNINIIIVISEYTVAQLDDFKRGGIDKFEIFWEKCVRDYEISRCEKYYNLFIPKDILRRIKEISKIKDAFEHEKQDMENQIAINRAIHKNMLKFGKWKEPKKNFSSVQEVIDYYEDKYGEEFAKQKHERKKNDLARKKIKAKKLDFEEKEDIALLGYYNKIEELDIAIENYKNFQSMMYQKIEKVSERYKLFNKNKHLHTLEQTLKELDQIHDEILILFSNLKDFTSVKWLKKNKQLSNLATMVIQHRSKTAAMITVQYQEYYDWFLQYRIAVAKFFIISSPLSIGKKDKVKLESLTKYWMNLDEDLLVTHLINKEVLQYDFSTLKDLLKIPTMEILTPGINLCDIAEKSEEKKASLNILQQNKKKVTAKKIGEKNREKNSSINVKLKRKKKEKKKQERQKQRDGKASYYALKTKLTKAANNEHLPKKARKKAKTELDKLVRREGKNWDDKDA